MKSSPTVPAMKLTILFRSENRNFSSNFSLINSTKVLLYSMGLLLKMLKNWERVP